MSELYKDKIEVSLDGRQVFYLFFGGAIIASLVFVLGVMVGKRLEARAHLDRAPTTSARDPLAALDRLATDGPHELTFRQALTGGAAPASDVEKQIAEIEKVRAHAAAVDPKVLGAEKPVEAAKAEAAKVEAAKVAAAKVAAAKVEAAKAEAAKVAATKVVAAKQPDGAQDKRVIEPKTVTTDAAQRVAAPGDVDPPAAKPKKGRFTLQLSAFQDKTEAEAFMAEVKGAGFEAYLTEAHVEDKGTFFRVRLGSYATYDDAVTAKTDFEHRVKKIAYVSRI
jgi:cell division septation protein DedD